MKTQFKARQKAYSAFIKTEYEIIKNIKFKVYFKFYYISSQEILKNLFHIFI